MRRRLLIVIVASLIGAGLVFAWGASAHNIDLAKAREVARNYARKVRDESGGQYAHFSTNCVRAFPGHNHIARCLIDYKSAEDTKKGVYTCRELIEIKLPPHHNDQYFFVLYGNHASSNYCGKAPLDSTKPLY